ncbi:MAG: MBL fold metallo-hydrolase [Acidobacteria bacterium]|nr:MBL fold metallo-hydrolase [Acidobacteriota bacterium]|tara:strand:- start:4559 stop:5485 length:927 start_codon:yes stop_codon:yes gene_type:complete
MQTITGGISFVDLMFLGRSRIIATAVLESAGGVTLVDPGPTTCMDTLKTALAAQGIAVSDLRSILLTHIHLDHAGATGSLCLDNPGLRVYVHERGAPHMLDPTKLLNSATRLYGEDMDRLWGEFLPVPQENLLVLQGGERIKLADRELEVAYTPGHASHHVSYFDHSSGIAFVGDTAGIRTGSGTFVMPPTPPPDIDIAAWKESLTQINRRQPSTLFLTHFGPHENPESHLASLSDSLDAMATLARSIMERDAADEEQIDLFAVEFSRYVRRSVSEAEAALYDQAAPFSQCWLGLKRYWKKHGLGPKL